jgi:TatD DNase family protein
MPSDFLVDSHCHLHDLPAAERDAALDRARERGVRGFLVPATRLDEAEEVLALCHRHPDVWCALGVHPHHASSWRGGDETRLRALLGEPRAVAVGECGLDFHYDHSPRAVQESVLRTQLALACELGLPAVVHNRDSDAAMLGVVSDPAFAALRADFHSFAGEPATARALVDRGFTLGFTGMITFPKADNIRALVPLVPRDRQLVETDTPYLAPVPHRGRRNEPAYVVEVAAGLAAVTGETREEVARRTTESFFRLFTKAGGPTA